MQVRPIATTDPHTGLRPGDTGTVLNVDDLGGVQTRWDNGSTLGLVPGVDEWELLCERCGDPLVPGCCVTVGDPAWEAER
ncbi:DUF4314 domain-containing protein [Agrococcus sediminis]|uniref:DUF4314 domain-containing protein n=1 Tax=Agrococcus sediminis TaxID=2599924 RepID=A0A5M8QFX0_9MICO|nr:DUF4314 domain-containing protein [Agrococcus sediminis]KAA6434927.1 DUF4314 domain-containing protein [Agrococcus sediminis]